MEIIEIYKEGMEDEHACQAVCLLMALRTLGSGVTKEDLYKQIETKGTGNLALPWGICNAASMNGFQITLISGDPFKLIDYSLIVNQGGMTEEGAKLFVKRLIHSCKSHRDFINLERFVDVAQRSEDNTQLESKHIEYMSYIVSEKLGIVMVTVKWHTGINHAVVIEKIGTDKVWFKNPNPEEDEPRSLPRRKFFEDWSHKDTDHDYFVVWKPGIDPMNPSSFSNWREERGRI
jgi:hypothetical protein